MLSRFQRKLLKRPHCLMESCEDGIWPGVLTILPCAVVFERHNGIERLNEEIRRRERVIRIFPNEESCPA
jgi:transposase-like protein